MTLSRLMPAAALVTLSACTDAHNPISLVQLKELSPGDAQALAATPFDPGAAVTVRGNATTVVFGENVGMIAVRSGAEKYLFATAAAKDLARQKFSPLTIGPGEEVVVTGILANGGRRISGSIAARADTIAGAGGNRIFARAAL